LLGIHIICGAQDHPNHGQSELKNIFISCFLLQLICLGVKRSFHLFLGILK